MLKKYGYAGLVFLPVMIMLVWMTEIAHQRNQGREVVVRLRGYDPWDLLSGHYISYWLDWDNTDCTQFEGGLCPKLAFGGAGRFYVPENKAQALDKAVRDTNNTAEIVFSYKEGFKPYALRLLVNGESWERAVDKN
ncbi:MAG: GDYXXLXY domain-containing protein [Alphaproteobacteria bacterium]|nr:GDYXXLXY domain-containing protein [Alphaproteobacteria bacterium]MBO5441224.1 GDYXXLXY domain-containing protein [Alphaproteobacteria bacterium]